MALAFAFLHETEISLIASKKGSKSNFKMSNNNGIVGFAQ